jgi:hypothetical protein
MRRLKEGTIPKFLKICNLLLYLLFELWLIIDFRGKLLFPLKALTFQKPVQASGTK